MKREDDEYKSFQYDGSIEILDNPLTTDEQYQIKLFRDTYNAHYIKHLSPVKQRYATDDNPILKRLLVNLHAPSINPDYIEGPISFYHIKLGLKTFYLFGELHINTKGHCSSVENMLEFPDYIKLLSRFSPSFTDIYVELPMVYPIEEKDDRIPSFYNINLDWLRSSFAIEKTIEMMIDHGYRYGLDTFDFESVLLSEMIKVSEDEEQDDDTNLQLILNQYKECIQPSTRTNEQCQLMRIHNIDIRTSWNRALLSNHFYIQVIYNIIDICETTQQRIKILNRIGLPILEVMEVFTKPDEQIIDSIIELYKTNPFIKKELEKRTYNEEAITQFIKYKIEQCFIDNQFEPEVFFAVKRSIETVTPVSDRYLREVYEILFEVAKLSMDMYALCRIFKEHVPREGSVSIQPLQSMNVIVYTGNDHIETYREFLLSDWIGGQELYSYVNPNNGEDGTGSCVMMRKK